jgi:bacillithiol biosynthesis cysteine-adding enzyme BshC
MSEQVSKPACHCISQTEIPHATRLFTDLLYHYDRVRAWYPHAPLDPASYRDAARSLDYPAATRAEVCAVLEEQARRFDAPPPVLANIERLRGGANAVVTGQQVGLFTGPAFTFYKALTAIKLAASLTGSGLDTVPIFWLATEDHDLEEINHAWLLTRHGTVEVVRSESKSPAEHAPVGEIVFTPDIDALVERTIALLPEGDGLAETAELLREAYRPGETFGAAFGRFMTRLFGRFGVIVMDPRSPRLRKLAAPVFRKALESAVDFHHALDVRNRELADAGYHNQVYVSEETSLLFVRKDGQRVPLRRHGGGFTLSGEAVEKSKLLEELDSHPEHFSPNVLLRPVVQDSLLPTLGYIGGPAELAYFAQAGAVYEGILRRMPVVSPRASFTLVDGHSSKLLNRYSLTLPLLFQEDDAVRQRMARQFLPAGLVETLSGSRMQLHAMLAALRKELGDLDQTLDDAAARAGRKMTYQLQRLSDKADRAVLRRNTQVERDAVYLLDHLHPRHSLQERVVSGVSFLAQYGSPLLDAIYEKVSIKSGDHQPLFL